MTTNKTKLPPLKYDKAPEAQRRRAARIYKKLIEEYPDAHCALNYRNPFELLIATILSAQCTDERVNKTTPALFEAFPTPQAMADTTPKDIEHFVKSCGFYRNKAKNIHGAANRIIDTYAGEVPVNMDDLLTLPGVARKTANVVLGDAFDIQVGVVVDTHVSRFVHRFGLSEHENTNKIERDLMGLLPRRNWTMFSHLCIAHGRATCTARTKLCTHPICKAYCSNARPAAK